MESLDGLASLTLLPHRQAFVVKFLCEVKYPLPKVKKQIKMSSMQIKYRGLRVSLKAIKMAIAIWLGHISSTLTNKWFGGSPVLKSVERIRKYILCCGLVAIQSSSVRFIEKHIKLYH